MIPKVHEVAFIFNLDGLLVDSYNYKARILRQCFSHALSSRTLPSSTELKCPRHEEIVKILIDGKALLPSLKALIPTSQDQISTIAQQASKQYYLLIQDHPKEISIGPSITLIRLLHDLGFKVCLLSKTKLSDAFFYRDLLQINFVQIIASKAVSNDSIHEVKSTQELYLRAADELAITPRTCVAFENSVAGVKAATGAGIYTVGLKSLYNDQYDLIEAGASEIVSNLLLTQKVASIVNSARVKPHTIGSTQMQTYTIQNLPESLVDDLVSKTYGAYKLMFTGRSLAGWRQKICDSQDSLTRIGVLYSDAGTISGYAIFKLRKVVWSGQTRSLYLISAGNTGDQASNILLLRFYHEELRRTLLIDPCQIGHVVDNFLSPSGYGLALRCLKQWSPSSSRPHLSGDDTAYLKYLAPLLGYTRADSADEQIYYSSSSVQRISNSILNAGQKYFLDRVGTRPGHGLYTIGAVTIDNLQPMINLPNSAKL